jgi:hypothetical protein
MSLAVLDSADVLDLLGQFDDPELIASGALHVLSLDAIRDRSRLRWATRQETVREFIERQFQKVFPAADHLVRMDDVNYLLIQSTQSGFGAQARALKLLREVLEFFLGASARSDIKLSRVTKIGPGGVETAPVEVSDADLARAAAMDWETPAPKTEDGGSDTRADTAPPAGPVMTAIDTSGAAAASSVRGDRVYDAMFLVEPVWGIRQRAVVSYLLRPLFFEHRGDRIIDADLDKASPADLLKLNLMVLAEAERLFKTHGGDVRFALHVPIHHASLTSSSGRQAILQALARMQPLAATALVVVLAGLDVGAPHSRIVELTSLLARRCRAVVALAPDLDCKIDRWRDAHLLGVAIDLNVLASANEGLSAKRLSDFAARAPSVAPALIAYSVPNSAAMLTAWSVGFTHVGGDLIVKFSDGALKPLRLEPIDLYRDSA